MIRQLTPEMLPHIHTARSILEAGPSALALEGEYDVCVVGSGPGGAVAAATLARAGARVALVERGPFFPPEEFNFRVLKMAGRLGHLEVTKGIRTLLYQGNGLGGGSLVFGAVAMRPPDFIWPEWQEESGLQGLNPELLREGYRHVAEVMSVTPQRQEEENPPNRIVREMASALGRPEGLQVLDRYTQGCAGVGLCNFGCGMNLKGTTLNSFIPLALETGNLEIFTEAEAQIVAGDRKASPFESHGVGVEFRDWAGGQRTGLKLIRARAVVLAAGAYFSSGLMLRTRGLEHSPHLGRRIYLQPHAQIFARFDDVMTPRGSFEDGAYIPRNGVPAIYEYTGHLSDRRFFWLASILYPANLATFTSHLPRAEHLDLMRNFHRTMSLTLTLRDLPEKSQIRLSGGRPQLHFRESRSDIENLRACLFLGAKALLAVGARQVFLPLLRPPAIQRDSDLVKIQKLDFSYQDLLLYSDHTSGGNSLAASPSRGATDVRGRFFGTRNVYASDSSLFPTACGANPSWTIMALARYVSRGLASEMKG